jgi:hypothetical protein
MSALSIAKSRNPKSATPKKGSVKSSATSRRNAKSAAANAKTPVKAAEPKVALLVCVDVPAVHLRHTGASLGDAGAVIRVVEHHLLAYPAVLSEDEHVVVKHRLAFE